MSIEIFIAYCFAGLAGILPPIHGDKNYQIRILVALMSIYIAGVIVGLHS